MPGDRVTINESARSIGLTGNIACGKSSVAMLLAELGIAVIDADVIAKEVTQPGQHALKKIIDVFGKRYLNEDGTLNRPLMREAVFQDPEKRKKLEAILHPAIRKRTQEQIEGCFQIGKKLVAYEASLLFEAGRQGDFDGVLLVTARPEIQLGRLLGRDKALSADLAHKMIESQMPQDQKAKLATWIIENNGSLEELRAKVQDWYKILK